MLIKMAAAWLLWHFAFQVFLCPIHLWNRHLTVHAMSHHHEVLYTHDDSLACALTCQPTMTVAGRICEIDLRTVCWLGRVTTAAVVGTTNWQHIWPALKSTGNSAFAIDDISRHTLLQPSPRSSRMGSSALVDYHPKRKLLKANLALLLAAAQPCEYWRRDTLLRVWLTQLLSLLRPSDQKGTWY